MYEENILVRTYLV